MCCVARAAPRGACGLMALHGRHFLPELLAGLEEEHLLGGNLDQSPVLGSRPWRASRLRRRKLPKPRSSTLSPSRKASVTHPRKMPTMASVCLLVRLSLSATLSVSSAFVMFPAPTKEHVVRGQGRQMSATTGLAASRGAERHGARNGAAVIYCPRAGQPTATLRTGRKAPSPAGSRLPDRPLSVSMLPVVSRQAAIFLEHVLRSSAHPKLHRRTRLSSGCSYQSGMRVDALDGITGTTFPGVRAITKPRAAPVTSR